MILQALYDYYQRKASDPESGIAPEGFEWKELPFLIVIDRDGKFVTLEDTREGEGKKKRAKTFLVPKTKARSGSKSYEVTNPFWDHAGYVLKYSKPVPENEKDREAKIAKNQELAERQFDAWLKFWETLPEALKEDKCIRPILKFYENEEGIEAAKLDAGWEECIKVVGCNLAFKIDGESFPVPCQESIRSFVRSQCEPSGDDESTESSAVMGRCLITGELGVITRLHSRTPISKDAKSLVGIQKNSGYDSYGKEQAFNAPVSKNAEFSYTTALNLLLGKDSRNKIQVGDATTIFWADRPDAFEEEFPSFFTMARKDDPDGEVLAVKNLYASVEHEREISDTSTRFFVLGLAPNAARISVRFWHTGTVAEFSDKIRQHYDDLEIVRSPRDQGKYSLFWYLVDIATEHKADNIPPNLAGNITRAILDGSPYPATLLQQAVRRIRAEQEVTRIRASLLKAYLNRYQRTYSSNEKEILVALDPDNTSPGYLLGRLFAVLEKIQIDAKIGGKDASTIRDRFYGAASASPVTVFPQLLKLTNHHLAKIDEPSFRIGHEKRLTEIVGNLPVDMPRHLRMEDQARFAIGYYHQRQSLFTKSEKTQETPVQGALSL
jgi:CRISPR-associated protein Csd1